MGEAVVLCWVALCAQGVVGTGSSSGSCLCTLHAGWSEALAVWRAPLSLALAEGLVCPSVSLGVPRISPWWTQVRGHPTVAQNLPV